MADIMENKGSLLISVIVPVYNRQDILDISIKSITSQTYRPLELILVDNASTDNSLAVCNEIKNTKNDDTIKIIVLSENKPGANAARNKGIKFATGDYLYFFDSDDILYPGSLEIIYRQLFKNRFPETIAFPFVLKFSDNKKSKRPNRYSCSPACQLFDTVLPTHGFMFKRSLISKTGMWDKNLFRWQDMEFGFRILINTEKLVWIKGSPLYEVKVHKDSISGNSYSVDHELLYKTLLKIQTIINDHKTLLSKNRLQRALCFRICSMASQIRLEGNEELGNKYFNEALNKLPLKCNYFSRNILRFHYYYTGKGGRGFWRLAEKIL